MSEQSHIFQDEICWYVMRVFKKEREVEELLRSPHGLPYFIAKKFNIRTFRGKKKSILEPSIPGIVFVHAKRKQIREFKKYCSFIQYCYTKSDDKEVPLIVPDKQMDNFIKIAEQVESDILYYRPEEISLSKGQRVRVHGGLFDGLEGVLLKVKGKRCKRIVVRIEGVSAIAASEISPDLIEIVKTTS